MAYGVERVTCPPGPGGQALIQAAMAFALGVLLAGLVVLLVTPAIWRRAMRLAKNRIEASVPLSRAEIEADKDQLRAGFAVANRRLEMETGRLRERLAEESIAYSRRADEAATLARDKDALVSTIGALEQRIAEISGSLDETRDKLTETTAEVAARDARLAEQEGVLAGVRDELGAAQLMTEELRLEMVARQTEIGNLSDRLAERTAAEQTAIAARDGLAAELAADRQSLAEEQKRREALEASFEVLQTERAGRLADLERRTAEMRILETELAAERTRREALAAEAGTIRADHARLVAELAERGDQIARLTAELADAIDRRDDLGARLEASEADHARARTEAAAGGDNLRKALTATEAEKSELALRLAALEDDLDALRAENAELRRVAGAEWESDREDSRRLRERLNEIAAGVVRITRTLEGGGNDTPAPEDDGSASPIPLTTVQRPAPAATGGETSDSTLAERLRALQHAARH